MTRLLGLALAASLLIDAQQHRASLRLEVTAASKPVPGAEVSLNQLLLKTNAAGIATAEIPLGRLEIRVRKPGFHVASASLDANQPREWTLAVELRAEEVVEEEITVYATRSDRRVQDQPVRVELLGEEEIQEKTMMSAGDIVMLLNETGGLRVQTTSPALGAASVRVQGMQGRYTRFLADGLPLFGQQGAGLGLLQIPPVDLGQVEVIKGVSSAMYGAGAMAGVVNLVARRPGPQPVRDLLFNRSTLGTTDAVAFLATPGESKFSLSTLLGGHWQETRDLDKDGWADVAGYERAVARPRLYWKSGDSASGFLTAGVIYENRNGGTVSQAVLPATGAPYLESLATRRYDLGGNFQSLSRGKYLLTARGAASWQNHDHRFGEIRERDRHDMAFGELSIRGSAGSNTWVAGVAAERESYVPAGFPRFAYTYTTPGLFLQDDFDLAAWLSVSASARADFHSRYGTFFSPRVSALMRAKGWTSRVSAGEGFFAPTPLTEETEAAGLARLQLPYGLLAERGRSLSADLSRQTGPLTTTLTVFGSRVRNPIYVQRDSRYALYNLEEPVRNAGMELLGILRKSPWALSASYTYVRSRQEVAGTGEDVPLTPRHSFGAVGMWEKEDFGRIGLECYVTGRQRLEENPFRPWSKPYVLVGALIEKKLGPLRLYFNAENITNVRQTRWHPLLRPQRAVDGRWTVDAWSPLDGRVFNGGVRLRW